MKSLKFIVVISFIFVCFFNQYRKNLPGTINAIVKYPTPDKNYLAVYEKSIAEFKNLIPKGSVVGYFASDRIVADENMTSDVVNYYLMQFFYAPVVFALDSCDDDFILLNKKVDDQKKKFMCKNNSFYLIKREGNMSLYKRVN